jgi:hypothetical protein
VKDVGGDGAQTEQVAVRDRHGRLGDVKRFDNGVRLATVRVPGREEDSLLVIFPFEQ